jgi:hypothetical protein
MMGMLLTQMENMQKYYFVLRDLLPHWHYSVLSLNSRSIAQWVNYSFPHLNRTGQSVNYCTIKINSSVTRHGGAWRDEFWNLVTRHRGCWRIHFSSRSVQILGSGLLWASLLGCRHSPYHFLAILKVSCFKLHNHRALDQIQPKFNREKWIFSCSTDLLK